MRVRGLIAVLTVLGFAGSALAFQAVTLSIESTQDGLTISPATVVDWTIKVAVSAGDNAGLALVCVDLMQDAANPEKFDLPPGDVGSIDATMLQFSRPAGISNPGEGAETTGYIGVQRGDAGEMDLVQIGGGQNTFGEAGDTMGTDFTAEGGIGQTAPQIVLSGSFAAPATEGTYVFELQNGLANVIDTLNTPPDFSPVSQASVVLSPASFSFTVGETICRGDCNCDGQIDFGDINHFVAALGSPPVYCDGTGDNADIDGNGSPGFEDINPFVDLLTSYPLPIDCPGPL